LRGETRSTTDAEQDLLADSVSGERRAEIKSTSDHPDPLGGSEGTGSVPGRTTQEAHGRNTPGTDGIAKLSARQRLALVAATLQLDGQANSIRRVWIPKPGRSPQRNDR